MAHKELELVEGRVVLPLVLPFVPRAARVCAAGLVCASVPSLTFGLLRYSLTFIGFIDSSKKWASPCNAAILLDMICHSLSLSSCES